MATVTYQMVTPAPVARLDEDTLCCDDLKARGPGGLRLASDGNGGYRLVLGLGGNQIEVRNCPGCGEGITLQQAGA